MSECLATPQHEKRSAIGCQNKVGGGGKSAELFLNSGIIYYKGSLLTQLISIQ